MDVVRMEMELNKVFVPAVAKSYINNQRKKPDFGTSAIYC